MKKIDDRLIAVNALRVAGFTYKRIGELFMCSIERARQLNSIYYRKVSDMNDQNPLKSLSVRTKNCLLSANINTLEQLKRKSDKQLLKIRNLGRVSLMEIRELCKDVTRGG